MSKVIVEKKRGLSPVWILPMIAICLAGWLLYKSINNAGIPITLQVKDSSGIVANKTPVMYKGNQVGMVKEIRLHADLQNVDLLIEMNRGTRPFLVEDVVFWIERVAMHAGKVTGLETLISGNYISVQPGVSQKAARSFVALNRRPPVPASAPGLHLKLRADKFKSLDINSGIYTQNIEIGTVQDYALQDDNTVLIDVHIEPEYSHLVKEGSRFWNASGITISGGISDLRIDVSTLTSILAGGINMETPESMLDSQKAENGQEFELFADLEALNADDKPKGLHITLETDDLGSVKLGSGIYYRKIKVGEVTGAELSKTFQKVLVNVTIYTKFTPIIRENTKFWNASGFNVSGGVLSGLSISTESFDSLMSGGIALATPNNDQMGKKVTDGHRFKLEKEEDGKWREWSPQITP